MKKEIPYRYSLIDGKPYVIQMPEMEKPKVEDYKWLDTDIGNFDRYHKAMEAYNSHLASRPKYPLSKEMPGWEGRTDIDPKEFKLQHQVRISFINRFEWKDITEQVYKDVATKEKRIIAIPIEQDKEGESEGEQESYKICLEIDGLTKDQYDKMMDVIKESSHKIKTHGK